MNSRDRLLNELCKNGNLEDHRVPLSCLLDLIIESGVKVSTRYDKSSSNYEAYFESDLRIRISLLNVVDPLDVIWKIMHEFGHYLSGKREPEDSTMDREEQAWIHADKILQQFPYFLSFKDKYEACKQNCLHSYREYFKLKNQGHN
ncbi:MAG: hypothetical protein E6H09_07760 [Bacteroidetes bacterium]|nr:MAG: hypothetical protein E6H09_07760 [Bacteroidota bacterium]